MKITMYELLGLVKDDKAPKKIKWGDTKYTLYIDEDTKQKYYQDDKCRYFFLSIKCLNDLNEQVEILEEEMCNKCHKYPAEHNQTYCEFCLGISKEEKKIPEKLDKRDFLDNETLDQVDADLDFIIDKVNEIIDYLQSKGE